MAGRRRHEEDNHQEAFFKWLAWTYPDIYEKACAIPNGGRRNPAEAARLKRQGVRAGVSDIFIAHPLPDIIEFDRYGRFLRHISGFHGLWIELKPLLVKGLPKPVVTQKQKEWIELMNLNNYYAQVCFGWEEAAKLVTTYQEGVFDTFSSKYVN